LIANKVLSYIKKKKGKAYIFKLDFHKAFDSVLWEYINEIMASMGFGSRWQGWIMQCISMTKMSVLVNGSPTEEFSLEKKLTPRGSYLSLSLQYCSPRFELYVAAWL
jgi:hypothetical protein